MKIKYFYIIALLMTAYFITSCLSLLFFKEAFQTSILSIVSQLFVTGFLTTLILKMKNLNIWTRVVHSLGLSILWIYVLGLSSSFVMPILGFTRPLDKLPFIYSHFGLIAILFLLAIISNWNSRIELHAVKKFTQNSIAYLTMILLSLTSLVGANLINSGGSNFLSIIWITICALGYFLVLFLNKSQYDWLKPYIIFLISLSILWVLSGRSSGLVGWDIIQEFIVAKTTMISGKWDLKDVKDAYNACLSISILPTVLSNVSSFSVEDIYKYLYPLIFAHFPVIIYFFLKRQSTSRIAYLSVLYIIAQPFFIQPMIALARQEVAFFFFALLLFSIFTETLKGKTKALLVGVYIFALVTSHYSTTYVSVILFTLTYSAIFLLYLVRTAPMPSSIKSFLLYKNWFSDFRSSIRIWMVIWLIFLTYFWYFLVTKTAGNVTTTFKDSLNNMSQLFKGEQKSQEVRQALPGASDTTRTSSEGLLNFQRTYEPDLTNLTQLQIQEIYERYPISPLYENTTTSLLSPQLASGIRSILGYLKDGLKFLVILGSGFLILRTAFRVEENIDTVIFSSVSSLVILAILLHPTLGVHYNISRIFLQLVVFLSIPLVLILDALLFKLRTSIRSLLIGLLLLLTFFNLQGLLIPLLGGIPVLQFYNLGTDYEKFYMYDSELVGVNWLERNRNFQNTVYGDSFAGLRVRKGAGFFTNPTILPTVFANNGLAYVYLSRVNLVENRTQVNFVSSLLRYTFPRRYVDDKKNLIYSNKNSAVYK